MLADQSYRDFIIKVGSVAENETLAEKRRVVTGCSKEGRQEGEIQIVRAGSAININARGGGACHGGGAA